MIDHQVPAAFRRSGDEVLARQRAGNPAIEAIAFRIIQPGLEQPSGAVVIVNRGTRIEVIVDRPVVAEFAQETAFCRAGAIAGHDQSAAASFFCGKHRKGQSHHRYFAEIHDDRLGDHPLTHDDFHPFCPEMKMGIFLDFAGGKHAI